MKDVLSFAGLSPPDLIITTFALTSIANSSPATIAEAFPDLRWVAMLRVLFNYSPEHQLLFAFIATDQLTTDRAMYASCRAFQKAYDTRIGGTYPQNISRQYKRMLKEVYREEKRITTIDEGAIAWRDGTGKGA